jgi:hypothetical protein
LIGGDAWIDASSDIQFFCLIKSQKMCEVQKGMVGEAAHTIAGDSNMSEGEKNEVEVGAALSGHHAG